MSVAVALLCYVHANWGGGRGDCTLCAVLCAVLVVPAKFPERHAVQATSHLTTRISAADISVMPGSSVRAMVCWRARWRPHQPGVNSSYDKTAAVVVAGPCIKTVRVSRHIYALSTDWRSARAEVPAYTAAHERRTVLTYAASGSPCTGFELPATNKRL
jgi:hypothetical protein